MCRTPSSPTHAVAIIVADSENSRIQVFDQSGKFLEQWTDFTSKPRGSMYITPDDTLYVSHVDSESISIMKNGKVIERVTGIGGRPHGVTLDQQGNWPGACSLDTHGNSCVDRYAVHTAHPWSWMW